jgi:hypothetical protein
MNSAASRQVVMPPMPEIGRPRVSGCAGDLGHHVQRDGLHRRAAIAAMAALAVDHREGREIVEIDVGDRVDRVDQADRIRPARFAAMAGGGSSVMLGVSFTMQGMRLYCLHPAGDHLDIFRHLADGRAHAAFGHAMRAAEVQFDPVGLGILDLFQDVLPVGFLAGHHQRNDQRPVAPLALDLLDLRRFTSSGRSVISSMLFRPSRRRSAPQIAP